MQNFSSLMRSIHIRSLIRSKLPWTSLAIRILDILLVGQISRKPQKKGSLSKNQANENADLIAALCHTNVKFTHRSINACFFSSNRCFSVGIDGFLEQWNVSTCLCSFFPLPTMLINVAWQVANALLYARI